MSIENISEVVGQVYDYEAAAAERIIAGRGYPDDALVVARALQDRPEVILTAAVHTPDTIGVASLPSSVRHVDVSIRHRDLLFTGTITSGLTITNAPARTAGRSPRPTIETIIGQVIAVRGSIDANREYDRAHGLAHRAVLADVTGTSITVRDLRSDRNEGLVNDGDGRIEPIRRSLQTGWARGMEVVVYGTGIGLGEMVWGLEVQTIWHEPHWYETPTEQACRWAAEHARGVIRTARRERAS